MEFIKLTPENLACEHICCAISSDKDCQVMAKKAWLADRLEEGLVFLKGDVRGKCFVEYLPAEAAWAPVDAQGYMYIDCLWVSGRLAGHGYAASLLQQCIDDSRAKGKRGVAVLSSDRKRPFLSDKGFLAHFDFRLADRCEPHFELLYLPFDDDAGLPRFSEAVGKRAEWIAGEGFTIAYTHQCPFTAKYVPLLMDCAREHGWKAQEYYIDSMEKARAMPMPATAFALFYNGSYITNEILSVKKFEKLAETLL